MLKISEQYTEQEICSFYRNAEENQDKIKLLQELTLLSKEKILNILNKNNYEHEFLPKNYSKKTCNKEKFLYFYNKRLSDEELSKYLGIAIATVKWWRHKLNLSENKK